MRISFHAIVISLFFVSSLTALSATESGNEVLGGLAGKWKGAGTLNGRPGCFISTLVSPTGGESAAISYQVQCPGYQKQNQFSFDLHAASEVTTTGFTLRKVTSWFGVDQIETLKLDKSTPEKLSFSLKDEQGGNVNQIEATLDRDPS